MAAKPRAFQNPYEDYNGEPLAVNTDGKLDSDFCKQVKSSIKALLVQLEAGLQQVKSGDYSVYTGQAGIALLYLHLYDKLVEDPHRQNYLEKAVGQLQPALQHLGTGVYTFLCGDAGTLAIAAVVYARAGDSKKSRECVSRLEQMRSHVEKDPQIPDEHLYGRAGYLAAVMFVQTYLGDQAIGTETISKVVKAILNSGQTLSKKKGWKSPLMYAWYRENYLGAAHGLAGIFYTLLLVKDPQLRPQIHELVRPSIDYMLTMQFPSGNFPAVIGDKDDRLVHWCHGAPGWTSLFTEAYKVFTDTRYLAAAEHCSEVTWHRGLLTKGYGLCHGAAGNAYTFLSVFRLTHSQKHLHRASKFAEWCFNYGKHGCRVPDTPFSLFEGMAGTIYFLCDLLEPLKSRFPAYEF